MQPRVQYLNLIVGFLIRIIVSNCPRQLRFVPETGPQAILLKHCFGQEPVSYQNLRLITGGVLNEIY